ncbi:MAG: YggT family protein [Bradyrhizobiaceae bacterium]|nr:YggT family protein [Bradyrhizobiaceae bacterium]
MASNPFLLYWWYHLPNLVLAALMYTLLGRVVLGFIFDENAPNYIWRFFVRVTDPVVRLVRYVTPLDVPHVVVLLFAAVWMFMLRVALLLLLFALGIAPTPGGAP